MKIDVDTALTFGKHKGKTPRKLAIEDRSYLEWGIGELDNSKWIAAFKEALALEVDDDELIRWEIDQLEDWEVSPQIETDIANKVKAKRQQKEKDEAGEIERAKLLIEYAQKMGTTPEKLKKVFDYVGGDNERKLDCVSSHKLSLYEEFSDKYSDTYGGF